MANHWLSVSPTQGSGRPSTAKKAGILSELILENCIDAIRPWLRELVSSHSWDYYKEQVVRFCNPGCKDKFEVATKSFEACLDGV